MSRIILSIGQGLVCGAKVQTAPRLFPAAITAVHYSIYNGFGHNNQLLKSSAGQFTEKNRNLYTETALGIDKLDALQERKSQLFAGAAKDRYIERLKGFVDGGDIKSVFRDDLINLMGIVDNDQQLDLLEELIVKTKDDAEALMDGWGTTVMRIYYKMGQIDRAVENLKDTDRFDNFFNQRGCYKIAITMLYNAGRYREVLDLYYLASEKLTQRQDGFERLLAPLAFAALAKMNTQEAFNEAKELYQKLSEAPPERGAIRCAQFVAFMAVNHNEPKYALNLISQIPNKNHITLRELKIASLIKLERYEDILFQLREFIESIRRDTTVVLKSTHEIIQQSIDKISDSSVRQELADILVEIKDGGHISDANLHDLLFKEMNDAVRPPLNMRDSPGGQYGQRGYDQRQRRGDGSGYNRQFDGNTNYQDNRRGGDRYYNDDYDNQRHGDQQQQGGGRDRQQRPPKRGFTYQNVDLSS